MLSRSSCGLDLSYLSRFSHQLLLQSFVMSSHIYRPPSGIDLYLLPKTVYAILFFWSHSVHFHPKQHYQFTVTKWYLSSLRFISHFEHIPLVITCLNQIWHFVGDYVFGNDVHCSFHVLQGYLLFVVPEIVKVKRSIFYFLKALPNYDSIGALLSYPRRCSYIS